MDTKNFTQDNIENLAQNDASYSAKRRQNTSHKRYKPQHRASKNIFTKVVCVVVAITLMTLMVPIESAKFVGNNADTIAAFADDVAQSLGNAYEQSDQNTEEDDENQAQNSQNSQDSATGSELDADDSDDDNALNADNNLLSETDNSEQSKLVSVSPDTIQNGSTDPTKYDFSEYVNSVSLSQVTSGTTVNSTVYPTKTDMATVTFVGPPNKTKVSSTISASTVSSSGFATAGNLFKSVSGSKTNFVGTIYGNYIQIVPNFNLQSVSFDLSVPSYSTAPYVAITDSLSFKTTNIIAQTRVTAKASTNYTLTCNLEAGKTYYLFVKPYNSDNNTVTKNKCTFSNLVLNYTPVTVKGNLPQTAREHDLVLKFTDRLGNVTEIEKTTSTEGTTAFTFDAAPCDVDTGMGRFDITVKDHPNLNAYLSFKESASSGEFVIDDQDIKNAVDYLFVTVNVKIIGGSATEPGSYVSNQKVSLNGESVVIAVQPDEEQTGTAILPELNKEDGLLTSVFNPPAALFNEDCYYPGYQWVRLSECTSTTLSFSFTLVNKQGSTPINHINVKDYAETEGTIPTLQATIPIAGSTETKYIDLDVQEDYYFANDTKVNTSPFGKVFETQAEPNTAVQFPITLSTTTSPDGYLWQVRAPIYTWSQDTHGDPVCTATYKDRTDSTILVTEVASVANGNIDIDIVTPASMTAAGLAKVTTHFSQYPDLFTNFVDEEIDLPKIDKHEHDGVSFTEWTKTDSLPTSGNYYLAKSVTVKKSTTIASGKTLNLCLNGNAIKTNFGSSTYSIFENKGTLNIYDCQHDNERIKHYFTKYSAATTPWKYSTAKTANYVVGGVITGGNNSAINNHGTLKIDSINMVGNTSKNTTEKSAGGGAITCADTSNILTLSVKNSCFRGNVAKVTGGAIGFGKWTSGGTDVYKNKKITASIYDCDFSYNATTNFDEDYHTYNGGGGAIGNCCNCLNTTVKINQCYFANNQSCHRGGAILCMSGSSYTLSNSTIENNKIATGNIDWGYGGGISYWNEKSCTNLSNLKLTGKVIVSNNYNAQKKYEDNIALRQSDDELSGAPCLIQFDPDNPVTEGSYLGVNFSYEDAVGLISKGYKDTYCNPTSNAALKYFVCDAVMSRLEYSVLLKTKGGTTSEPNYEVYLTKHKHTFSTSVTTSITASESINPAKDTAKVACTTGDIIESKKTYSKCKYGENPICATIQSRDGGVNIKGEEAIEADGEEHPVEISNQYEFETQVYGKFVTDSNGDPKIKYQRMSGYDTEGNEDWEDIDYVPSYKGTYRATVQFYPIKNIDRSKSTPKVVYETSPSTLTSNSYSIGGIPLTIQVNASKEFDESTDIKVTADDVKLTGQVEGDDVSVNVDEFVATLASPYASVKLDSEGKEVERKAIAITGFDASKAELTGDDAYKYEIKYIGNSYGYVYPGTQKPYYGFVPNDIVHQGETWSVPTISTRFESSGKPATVNLRAGIQDAHGKSVFHFEQDKTRGSHGNYDQWVISNDTLTVPWGAQPSSANDYCHYTGYTDPLDIDGDGIVDYSKSYFIDDGKPAGQSEKSKVICVNVWKVKDTNKWTTVTFNAKIDGSAASTDEYSFNAAKGDNCYYHVIDTYANRDMPNHYQYVRSSDVQTENIYFWNDNEDGGGVEFDTIFGVQYDKSKYRFIGYEMSGQVVTETTGVISEPVTFTAILESVSKPNVPLELSVAPAEGTHDVDLNNLKVGDKITYTLKLTNKSNKTLYIKEEGDGIIDNLLGYSSKNPYCPATKSGYIEVPVDGEYTITLPSYGQPYYTVTDQDIRNGFICNIAMLKYHLSLTDDDDVYITSPYSITNTTEKLVKDLQVNVETIPVDPVTQKQKYSLGDKLKYKITVTNNGNTLVNNIDVDYTLRDAIGDTPQNPFDLPAGDSYSFETGTYTIKHDEITTEGADSGFLVNSATASGEIIFSTKTSDPVSGTYAAKDQVKESTVLEANKPLAADNLIYSGQSQFGIKYGTTGTGTCTGFSVINAEQTDAGTYTAVCKLDPYWKWWDGTYADKEVEFTIAPKTLNLDVGTTQAPVSQDYNGEIFTHDIVTSGESPEIKGFVTVVEEGLDSGTITTNSANAATYTTEGTAPGEVTVVLTPNENTKMSNYTVTNNINMKIAAPGIDSTRITAAATDKTYNTQEQQTTFTLTDSATNLTLTQGTDYKIISGASATNAGKQSVVVQGMGNYSGEKTFTDVWQIYPATITINLTGWVSRDGEGNETPNTSIAYDGVAHTVPALATDAGYTAKMTAGKTDKITLDTAKIYPQTLSISGTKTGTYDLLNATTLSTFKYVKAGTTEADPNYECTFTRTSNTGILEITKNNLSSEAVSVAQYGSLTYNATEQTAGFQVKVGDKTWTSGSEEFNAEFEVTDDTGTDASHNYTATITAKAEGNFEGSTTAKWAIGKADLVVDASALSEEEVYCDEHVAKTISTAKFGSDSFTTTLTTNGTNVLRDGAGDLAAYTGIGSGATNLTVTTQPDTGTKASNYKDATYTTSAAAPAIKITPKDLSVTPTAVSVPYDTIAHCLSKDGVAVDGLLTAKNHVVNTEDITFGSDNTATNVADSKTGAGGVAVQSVVVKNNASADLTSNYEITYNKADLKITKAKITLDIKGNIGQDEDNFTYNATPKTVSKYNVVPTNVTACAVSLFTESYLTPASAACNVTCTNVEGKKYYQVADAEGGGTHDLTAADFKYADPNVEATSITYDAENSGFISIQSAKLTLTVNESVRRNDEDPQKLTHTLQDSEISGLQGDDTMSGTITTDDTDLGDYTHPKGETSAGDLTWNFTFDPTTSQNNYWVAWENVILNIREDLLYITISGHSNESAKYNGTMQKVEEYEASASEDSTVEFKPECLKYKDGNTTTVAKGTNAGTYYMGLDVKDFVYYDPSDPTLKYKIVLISDGHLIIGQHDITREMMTIGTTEFTYDGKQKSPEITIKDGDYTLTSKDYDISGNTGVDKGDYVATIKGKGNYSGSEITIPWRINSAEVNFTITGKTATYPYNGQAQSLKGYSYSTDILQNLIDPSYFAPNHVPEALTEAAVATGTDAGDYYMKLDQTGFAYNDPKGNIIAKSFTVTQGKLTITGKQLSELNVYITDAQYTYDGTEHEPDVALYNNAALVDPSQYVLSGTTKATDAGTYTITINPAEKSSYSGSVSVTWQIISAYVEINISGKSLTKDYDGVAATLTGFNFEEATTTGLAIDSTLIKPNQTCQVSGTNAGYYQMGLDINKFSYDGNNLRVKFLLKNDGFVQIDKKSLADSDIVIDTNCVEYVYNGSEQGPGKDGILQNGVKYIKTDGSIVKLQNNIDFIATGVSATNAGDYTLHVTGNGNYEDETTVAWKIKKAVLDVNIEGNISNDQVYDGTKKIVTGYTATPASGQEELAKLISISPASHNCAASGVDAGTYYMGLNASGKFSATNADNVTTNFNIAREGYIQIQKADISTAVASASNLVYNGAEQQTTVVVMKGTTALQEGRDYVVGGEYVATDVNNVGDPYKAAVTATENGNYTGSLQDVDWNITKLTMPIDIIGKQVSREYDATEQTVVGEEEDNFLLVSSNKNFDSSKVTKPAAAALPRAKGTDVGTYKAGLTTEGFSYADPNVEAEFSINADSELTITKATIEINVEDSKIAEATSPQALSHTLETSEISGLKGSNKLTGTLVTNSSDAGSYVRNADYDKSFTSSLTFAPTTSEANYTVAYNVSLTILPNDTSEKVVYITGNTKTETYDGDSKEVSGYKAKSNMTDFDEAKISPATSDVKVSAKDAGTYQMGITDRSFTYTDDPDVTFVVVDGALTINPVEISNTMFDIPLNNFTYDATQKTASVRYNGSLKGINPDDYDVINNTATDVGTYSIQVIGKRNLTGSISNLSWSISKANLTIDIDKSKQYDANKFSYVVTQDDLTGYCERTDGTEETLPTLSSSSDVIGAYTYGATDKAVKVSNIATLAKNYQLTYNVKLDISKRNLTAIPNGRTYTYDGNAHSLQNADIEYDASSPLLDGHTITNINWVNNTLTNVGINDNVAIESVKIIDSAKNDVSAYYNFSSNTATLRIDKANMKINITGEKASFAYDGQGHSVSKYFASEVLAQGATKVTGLFKSENIIFAGSTLTILSDVGTAYMTLDPSMFSYKDSNVNAVFETTNGEITITETKMSAVNVTATNKVYNARQHSADLHVTYNGANLVPGKDYDIDESSVTKATDAGTYNIKVIGKGNFDGEVTITWEIAKADLKVEVSGKQKLTFYDGTEHVFPGSGEVAYDCMEVGTSGVYSADKIKYSGTSSIKATETGTYYMGLDASKFAFEDTNVNALIDVKNDATLSINKSDISDDDFEVIATDFTYNATAQNVALTVTQKSSSKVLQLNKDYEILDSATSVKTATDVGTYYASIQGIGQYLGTKTTIAWKITPANVKIAITGNNYTSTYNGQVQYASGYKATVVEETGSASELYDASCVALNEGSSDVVEGINYSATAYTKKLYASDFTYANKNINAEFVAGSSEFRGDAEIAQVKLTINKKKLLINAVDVKKEDTKVLTHKMQNYEASGQVGDQIVGGTVSTKNTEVGTYTGDQLDFAITIDGQATEAFTAASSADGASSSKTADSAANGIQKAWADENVVDNYELDSNSTLQIVAEGETPFIRVTASSSEVVYDGSAHTIAATDFTIESNISVDQTKLTVDMTPVTATNVGEYTAAINGVTYTGASAAISWTSGTLKITQRSLDNGDVVVTYTGGAIEYTGTQAKPDATKVSVVDSGIDSTTPISSDNYTVSFAEGTTPGEYAITVSAKSGANYKESNSTGKYVISKANRVIKVTGTNGTYTYDGASHTVDGFSASEFDAEGQLATNKLIDTSKVDAGQTCSVTGTNVQDGGYTMGIDIKKFAYSGENKDYINLSFELVSDGHLTINAVDLSAAASQASLKIAAGKDTYTYNAKQQGPNADEVIVEYKSGGVDKQPSTDDFSISGNKAVNAVVDTQHPYTLTVTGKGNYTGSLTANWKINKAQRTVQVAGNNATLEYNGSEQKVVGYSVNVTGYDAAAGEEPLVNKDLITPASGDCVAARSDIGTTAMKLGSKSFAYVDSNVDATFVTPVDGYITIEKCSLDKAQITIDAPNYVYAEGDNHVPVDYQPTVKVTFAGNTLVSGTDYVLSGDTGTKNQVGEYTINVSAVNTSKFKNPETPISIGWTISKANVEIYVTGAQYTTTYNGKAQKISDSGSALYSATSTSNIFDTTKLSVNDSASLDKERTDAGREDQTLETADAANFSYTDDNVDASITIAENGYINVTQKNIAELTVPEIADVTYDGQSHYPSFELKYGDLTLQNITDYTLEAVDGELAQSAVGTYKFNIVGCGNYYGKMENVEWSIVKKAIWIKVVGDHWSGAYDGQVHTVKGYTATAYDNETCTIESTDNVFKYANLTPSNEDANFSCSSSSKCNLSFGMKVADFSYKDTNVSAVIKSVEDGYLIIGEKTLTDDDLDITWPSDDYTYNGAKQQHLPISVKLKDGTTIDPKYYDVTSEGINAGTYTTTITFKDDYAGTVTQDWTINPKTIAVSCTGEDHTYDGHSAKASKTYNSSSPAAEQLYGSDEITLNFETSQPDVGEYAYGNSVGFDIATASQNKSASVVDGNYLFTYADDCVKINIVKRDFVADDPTGTRAIDVVVEDVTYNGLEQTPTVQVYDRGLDDDISLLDPSVYTVTVNKTAKDADNYTLSITSKADSNYNENTLSGYSWTINRATVTIAEVSSSHVYDFEAGENVIASTKGVSSETFKTTFTTKGTDAGTYYVNNSSQVDVAYEEISSSGFKDSNYDITCSGAIKIEQKNIDDCQTSSGSIDLSVKGTSYNGGEQSPSLDAHKYTTAGGKEITLSNTDISLYNFTPIKNVPETGNTYSVTYEGKGNYCGQETVSWTFDKATLSCYVDAAEPEYMDTKPYDESVYTKAGKVSGTQGSDTASVVFATDSADAHTYTLNGAAGKKLTPAFNFGAGILARNYTDPTYVGSVEITPKPMTRRNLNVQYSNLTYNGSEQALAVSVSDKDTGKVLTQGESADYKLSGDTKAQHVKRSAGEVDSYTFTLNCLGNYSTDSAGLSYTWKMLPYQTTFTKTADSVVYNGAEAAFESDFVGVGGETLHAKYESNESDADIYSSIKGNLECTDVSGTGTPATDPNDYDITHDASITILQKNLSNTAGGGVVFSVSGWQYSGETKEATHSVTYTPTGKSALTLVDDTDFTVDATSDSLTQKNVAESGTYTTVINGKGNYTGSTQAQWKITPIDINYDMTTMSVGQWPAKPYDGSVYECSATLGSDQGFVGSEAATVNYKTKGSDAGEYGADKTEIVYPITYAGGALERNYTLTLKLCAKINPHTLERSDVIVNSTNPTYNGAAQGPVGITVKYMDGEKEIFMSSKDCKITYDTHINVYNDAETQKAEYNFTVEGIGNYTITEPGYQYPWYIDPASLVVTPDNKTKTYGTDDPEFTYKHAGVIEGETAAFTGALTREQGENVGQYAIEQGTLNTATQGTFRRTNYAISIYGDSTLTITPAKLDPQYFDVEVVNPIYTGEEQLVSDVKVKLKGTTKYLEEGEDKDFVIVGDKHIDVVEEEVASNGAPEIAAANTPNADTPSVYNFKVEGRGNYQAEGSEIPATWSIDPKPIAFTSEDYHQSFNGEKVTYSDTIDTGIGEQAFDVEYTTTDSAPGVYSIDGLASDKLTVKGPEPTEGTKASNYKTTKYVANVIIDAVPTPEPTPDPTPVDANTGGSATGDNSGLLIAEIAALFVVVAGIVVVRRKRTKNRSKS